MTYFTLLKNLVVCMGTLPLIAMQVPHSITLLDNAQSRLKCGDVTQSALDINLMGASNTQCISMGRVASNTINIQTMGTDASVKIKWWYGNSNVNVTSLGGYAKVYNGISHSKYYSSVSAALGVGLGVGFLCGYFIFGK